MSTNNFEDFEGDWADEFDDLTEDTDTDEYVSPLSSGVVTEDDDDEELAELFDEVDDSASTETPEGDTDTSDDTSDSDEDDADLADIFDGDIEDEDDELVTDEDDFDNFNLDDEVVVAEPVSTGSGLALRGELVGDEIVFTDSERQLTKDEARSLTDNIRSTSEVLYSLVAKAYAGKAWIPLGYTSFKEYMNYEFDISVSKAYNLINQASVIEALEAATPEGTRISVNQTSAKKLKKVIDELVPEIEDATRDMGKREASEYLEQRIQEVTTSERHGAPPGGYEDDYADDGGRGSSGGYGGGSGGGGGGYGGGFDNPSDFDSFPGVNVAGEGEARNSGDDVDVDDFDIDLSDIDLDFGDIDELEDGESDENDKEKLATDFKDRVKSTYNFYSAIASLQEMPDVDEIIDSIPESRKDEIDSSLNTVMTWLQDFEAKWKVKMETFDQNENEALESEADDTHGDGDFDDDDFSDFVSSDDFEDSEEYTDNNSEELAGEQ